MKLKTSLIAAMLLAGVWASAEDSDEKLLNLQLMARFDYQREYVRGEANSAGCGFRGKNVSVARYVGHDKTDLLELQFCQSPCRESDITMDIYSYNLMWSGKHGVFRPLWSLNFMEYDKGEFLNCLDFGNYFELGMEFFPLRNSRILRIHAAGCRTFGRNGNPEGTLEDMQTFLNMGVSWRMNLLSFRKK